MNPLTGRFWTADSYEGQNEDPVSLHKYLYFNGDPVGRLDPSGNMSLAEVNATMGQIANFSRQALNVLRFLDKVQSVVDGVESVIGIYNLVSTGQVRAALDEAVLQGFGQKFRFSAAVDSLERNFSSILSASFAEWSQFFFVHGRKLKGYLLYLPSPYPGVLPELTIPTGVKIGGRSVSLVAGGKSKGGRVVGIGVDVPGLKGATNHHTIWHMDWHPFHIGRGVGMRFDKPDRSEISVWKDDDFHYHVLKPPKVL